MLENDTKNNDDEVIDDADFVPEDDSQDEETAQKKIQLLRKKLLVCEEEKRTHLEELSRARADFLNSKRRLDEQFARDKERATDRILTEILTLVDSFDTAIQDTARWESVDGTWRTGMEGIYSRLLSILTSSGVVSLDPRGETFNPNEHEAVSNIPVTDTKDDGRVIAVLQKGFKRNDMIIRPARVVVGHIA